MAATVAREAALRPPWVVALSERLLRTLMGVSLASEQASKQCRLLVV
jgi:hypothetical protein